jgi:hypothetical protein
MVSSLSRACSDQVDSSGAMDIFLVLDSQDTATNALSAILYKSRKPPGPGLHSGPFGSK